MSKKTWDGTVSVTVCAVSGARAESELARQQWLVLPTSGVCCCCCSLGT
jgi:hypothetical protein